jgi:hypothetical protein
LHNLLVHALKAVLTTFGEPVNAMAVSTLESVPMSLPAQTHIFANAGLPPTASLLINTSLMDDHDDAAASAKAADITRQLQEMQAKVFFEKPLTSSDASGSGRVVIPKVRRERVQLEHERIDV